MMPLLRIRRADMASDWGVHSVAQWIPGWAADCALGSKPQQIAKISLRLVPHEAGANTLPALRDGALSAHPLLRMHRLRLYVADQLPAERLRPEALELLCGDRVVDDMRMTVAAVRQSMWTGRPEAFALSYRRAAAP